MIGKMGNFDTDIQGWSTHVSILESACSNA